MATTIGVVGCSKTKLREAAPARELYSSPLFRAARDYCEATYDRWLILSALYGLVEPHEVIDPYDVTLLTMSPASRRMWAMGVAASPLGREIVEDESEVHLHAGALYREAFSTHGLNLTVYLPTAGLGIGRQLAWYAARRARRAVS